MSLPLRKVIQPILDNNNMESYHAAISNEKYFRVVGECGKPLFTVTGIEFTRREPTVADIEFASELFVEFLLKHKAKLDTFMAAGAAFNKLTKPKRKQGIYELGKDYSDNFSCIYTDGPVKVTLHESSVSTKIAVTLNTDKQTTTTIILNFKANKVLMDKAIKVMKLYATYHKSSKALENARSALSSCEI